MKFSTLLTGALASLTTAQTAAPYTDANSGITFNAFQHSSGLFFGIALPENSTSNTDFIATVGGKGTGWTGISLGGGMLNKLLLLSWPNQQSVISSFRKAARYGSPAVATGTFSQSPIANGTYVNSTHWTYTFLCSKCIQSDGTTFKATNTSPRFGFALNPDGPFSRSSASSSVSRHTVRGQAVLDLSKAKSSNFDTWKSWAEPGSVMRFVA